MESNTSSENLSEQSVIKQSDTVVERRVVLESDRLEIDHGDSGRREFAGGDSAKSAEEFGRSREVEYSATELRKLLQELFPQRRLVLSQFTFFNQSGISKPTGQTFRRGRRCYRLVDVLPVACVLALKEEGIPFKNIETVPDIIRNRARDIFACGRGVRISGYRTSISLDFPRDSHLHSCDIGAAKRPSNPNQAIEEHLEYNAPLLCWSFDIGFLAQQLENIARGYLAKELRKAA